MSQATTSQTARTNPAIKPPGGTLPTSKAPEPSSLMPKEKDVPPTFATLRQFLVGREVTIYAPPQSTFTTMYCDTKKESDPGRFTAKLLDLTVDDKTGEPRFGLIEYRERNARRWFQRDLISLSGCAISVALELERDESDDEEIEDVKNRP